MSIDQKNKNTYKQFFKRAIEVTKERDRIETHVLSFGIQLDQIDGELKLALDNLTEVDQFVLTV